MTCGFKMFLFVKLVVLGLFFIIATAKAAGNTLVLLDNQVIRETHSIFFKSLQGNISYNYRLCAGVLTFYLQTGATL